MNKKTRGPFQRRLLATRRKNWLALAFSLSACYGLVGCHGIGSRNPDGLPTIMNDDDWSIPESGPPSQVPRPTPYTQRRLTDGAPSGPMAPTHASLSDKSSSAAAVASAATPENPKPQEPAKSGPVTASLSSKEENSEPKAAPQSTLPQASESQLAADKGDASKPHVIDSGEDGVDLDGALEELPAPYRELLKRQLLAAREKKSPSVSDVAATEPSSIDSKRPFVKVSLSDTEEDTSKNVLASATVPTSGVEKELSSREVDALPALLPMPVAGPSSSALLPASGIAPSANAASPAGNAPGGTSTPEPQRLPPLTASSTPTASGSISTAVHSTTEFGQWNHSLSQSIELLEKQIAEQPTGDDNLKFHREIALRMLYVSARKLDEACKPIAGMSEEENDYIRHQMQALFEASNPDAMPVRSRHLSLVMNSQRQATDHLAAVSNLEVRSPAFCTEVERYGVITKFSRYQFQPDQEVLLYCELENVAAKQVRDGFETQLQGSYEIVDSNGQRISEQILPMEPDVCQNHRRDYFIVYKIFMPQQIAPGNYKLRLTVEDMNARKFGQSTLDFQIKK